MKRIIVLLTILFFTSRLYSQSPCPGMPTVTYAGKTYNTVRIASQCWLKENLDVGIMISGSINASNNGTIEKYCYENLQSNCSKYGGLYQWDEAMQYSTSYATQGICPIGWHIPTKSEFELLMSNVKNDANAIKLIGGNNSSGFSAVMSGWRHFSTQAFDLLNTRTDFWGSTINPNDNLSATNFSLQGNSSYMGVYNSMRSFGFSVRCIRDVGVSVKSEYSNEMISNYSLYQNYPNPFNPSTTIRYQIPVVDALSAAEVHITLKVYDALGTEVATIVNQERSAGVHEISFDGSNLSSGIYFYKLTAGSFTQTKKLILVK